MSFAHPIPSVTVAAGNSSPLLDGTLLFSLFVFVIFQAIWPVVPRVALTASAQDDRSSNYVVVGSAPGLKVRLYDEDYSLLWNVSTQRDASRGYTRETEEARMISLSDVAVWYYFRFVCFVSFFSIFPVFREERVFSVFLSEFKPAAVQQKTICGDHRCN